jgi:hypothetical protein
MKKDEIVETHKSYKEGGSRRNPYKCDGENNSRDDELSLIFNAKNKKTKKPVLTKSQKDFAKKLSKALDKKRSSRPHRS